MSKKNIGKVGWMDLTIDDADSVSKFYSDVVGWDIQSFDMGGYNDYCMNHPETGDTQAGVCHARGGNTGLPAQWLIYVGVENLDKSLEAVAANGGKVHGEKRSDGRNLELWRRL